MTALAIDKMSGIFKAYNVRKASLFGSAARNEETENSDVDIIVSFAGQYDLLDMIGLKLDLEDTLSLLVDIVTYEALQNDDFTHNLLTDEKVIYEKN